MDENNIKIKIDYLSVTFPLVYLPGENELFNVHETVRMIANDYFEIGFDPIEGKLANMFELGVIDPAKVTRVSLENAVSVAIQFLNTS